MTQKAAIVWFRQDLRLADNPALTQALEDGYAVIPVYILDDDHAGQWKMGGASRWWLYQSLTALNGHLREHMVFRLGKADEILPDIIQDTGAQAVYWNRCYEPWRIKRDEAIKAGLKDNGLEAESFNGLLLWEPWTIKNQQGLPYKVFTPYYRKGCLKAKPPEAPLSRPERITYADHGCNKGALDDLNLMPSIQWYKDMEAFWTPGEDGAHERLQTFLENGFHHYKAGRDTPGDDHTSRLSPHLHFGEISPREAWHAAQDYGRANSVSEQNIDCFCSELGWREFSYYLLYHFPHITWENFQEKFNDFPWSAQDSEDLERWRRGKTGIPIVDAGMRQLWQTGWMHNRVRMIVGSLLVKNMLIHWHRGEEWFWDCLVDADLASNSASWQWIAGCGADAAPYFRIFNPVTQGEKFDPDGHYVREFVPELRDLDTKYIHKPWEATPPPADYPAPIVDLKESRAAALKAFESTKQSP